MAENLEISKDGYLNLLKKIYENKLEEREFALDRYRKADEQMESPEQFVLIGKNAVSFLNLASLSTNDLASIAKEIKSIVYKETQADSGQVTLEEGWKDSISDAVEELEKTRKFSRKIDNNVD